MNVIPEESTDEVSALLAGYALGTLTPDEADFVNRNLPRKPLWRQELETFFAVTEALPYLAEPHDVPVRVRAGLLAKIDAIESQVPLDVQSIFSRSIRQDSALVAAAQPDRRWVRRLPRLAWAAAIPTTIAAIVLIMYTVVIQGKINDQEAELASYQQNQSAAAQVLAVDDSAQSVITLSETTAAPLARARLFIDQHANTAMLVARDLPPLQDGESYVVWVRISGVDSENSYTRVGVLSIDEIGRGNLIFAPPAELETYVTILVTHETVPDLTAPQGPRVLSAGI